MLVIKKDRFLLKLPLISFFNFINQANEKAKKRVARKKGRETLRLRRGLIKGVEGKKGGKPSTPGGGITYDALSSEALRES